MTETIPLYSIEAEMSLLGAMLLSENVATQAARAFVPDAFYRPAHRLIFASMVRIVERQAIVDMITLPDDLRSRNELADAGGEDYLIQLATYVPSAANAKFYGQIIRDKWDRRKALDACKAVQEKILAGDSLDIVRAESQLITDGIAKPFKAPVVELSDIIDRVARREQSRGVSTGFPLLDMTSKHRGFAKGQLTVPMADTGQGKTTWAVSCALQQLRDGKSVVFATFADNDQDELAERILKGACGFGAYRYAPDLPCQSQVKDGVLEIATFDCRIYDASAQESGDDVETFAAWLEAENARRPIDCCYVDYAQELTSSRGFKETTPEQKHIAHYLRRVAMRLDIPLVVMAQVTKTADGFQAMYSRVWEQVAGWVLIIENERVFVKKSRHGGRGSEAPHRYDQARWIYLPD